MKSFDGMPADESIPYTSIFVSNATATRHPLDGCMEDLKRDLGDPVFDSLRETPRFRELVKKTDM